jgi:hypothetical protein
MYLQEDLPRLVHSFEWGFLSDRLVESLSKYARTGTTTQDEKKVLEEGISFVDLILNGRKQITTGQYESNALESLIIYNKSVSIILDMPDLRAQEIDAREIEKIFEAFKTNLIQIVKGEQVSPQSIDKTKDFFNSLREATLDDGTSIINGLYESRSSKKWELIPGT